MASPVSPEIMEAIKECCRREVRTELASIREELQLLRDGQLQIDSSDTTADIQVGFVGVPSKNPRAKPSNASAKDGYALLMKADVEDEDEEQQDSTEIDRTEMSKVKVTVTDVHADFRVKSEEYQDIIANARDEMEVSNDVWGASMFAIVKDFADIAMGEVTLENTLRMTMIFVCMVLNLFLQFAFLYFIADLVLFPNIRRLQVTYKEYHEKAFKSGEFDEHEFEALGIKRVQLCEMALTKVFFMAAVLFLWTARCLSDLRAVWRSVRSINMLPRLPDGVAPTHMVHEVKMEVQGFLKERKNMVVCLNRTTRAFLYLFIFIPRSFIALALLLMGVAFLTATQSFTELILNSLAMSFIYDIDDILMVTFLPERLKHNLEHTKIVTPPDEFKKHLAPQELDDRDVKAAYTRSVLYLLTVTVLIIVWFYYQPIIPGYDYDVSNRCNQFVTRISSIPCLPWDRECFPMG